MSTTLASSKSETTYCRGSARRSGRAGSASWKDHSCTSLALNSSSLNLTGALLTKRPLPSESAIQDGCSVLSRVSPSAITSRQDMRPSNTSSDGQQEPQRSHRIERLPGSPHRDNSVFAAEKRPSQRDLDAWLSLDERDLVAVECKTWTASSRDGKHVLDASQDELSRYARDQWIYVSETLLPTEPDDWDDVNKIRLPLKVPDGYGHKSPDITRVLAIWRPVSQSGLDPWTKVTCRTPIGPDAWTDVPVKVFSGSLYLRQLRASDISVLPSVATDPHDVRDAVNACIC